MSPPPQWVKDLKPSPPQGTELIKEEREKSKISVEKLSNFLFTREVLQRQERILQILQAEKVFDKSNNYFDGRVDRFKTALARAKRLRQLQVKHNWNKDEYMVANELISEPGPYGLHASMYLVSLFDLNIFNCSKSLDHTARSRYTRTAQAISRASREL